jgi:hypothetical protein
MSHKTKQEVAMECHKHLHEGTKENYKNMSRQMVSSWNFESTGHKYKVDMLPVSKFPEY